MLKQWIDLWESRHSYEAITEQIWISAEIIHGLFIFQTELSVSTLWLLKINTRLYRSCHLSYLIAMAREVVGWYLFFPTAHKYLCKQKPPLENKPNKSLNRQILNSNYCAMILFRLVGISSYPCLLRCSWFLLAV